jgi:hypothetical protein
MGTCTDQFKSDFHSYVTLHMLFARTHVSNAMCSLDYLYVLQIF